MARQSNEDAAKALEQLHSGEFQGPHDPEEAELDGAQASGAPSAGPAAPARPAQPATEQPGVRPAQPPGAAPPPPPKPPAGMASQGRAAPGPASGPQAPGTSPARPAAPALATGPQRPAVPIIRTGAPAEVSEAQTPPEQVSGGDEDDAVIVPAPDMSVFLHKRHAAAEPSKARAFGQGLTFRRTFIPILLTGGLICLVLGALHFAWNSSDNPLGGLPGWLVALLFVFALLLWGLAGMNMAVVRHMMEAQRQPGGRSAR